VGRNDFEQSHSLFLKFTYININSNFSPHKLFPIPSHTFQRSVCLSQVFLNNTTLFFGFLTVESSHKFQLSHNQVGLPLQLVDIFTFHIVSHNHHNQRLTTCHCRKSKVTNFDSSLQSRCLGKQQVVAIGATGRL
jgi:hypothetical protein